MIQEKRDPIIFHWLPVGEISVESVRERGSPFTLPPLYYLHIWFARRPLTVSRAALLGSLLPTDGSTIKRQSFLNALGIPPSKDIVGIYQRYLEAKEAGRKPKSPFTWAPAYRQTPSEKEMRQIQGEFQEVWGTAQLKILDPMAGGGSIPFEAMRLGLTSIAGEYNPVAFIILKATLEYPSRFGERLVRATKRFAEEIHAAAEKELEEFFPREQENETVYAYLWARTIKCSSCGLSIPLSPNWRLDGNKVVMKPVVEENRCSFKIIKNPKKKGLDPLEGTVSRGSASCPKCGTVMDGDYLREEAKRGRMGHRLFAVCTKRKIPGQRPKWHFRAPTKEELEAVEKADRKLKEKLPKWEKTNLLPQEHIQDGLKTRELLNYGFSQWFHLFNSRQLLCHLTYLEKFLAKRYELFQGKQRGSEEWDFASAVATEYAMIFDTCVDYNSLLTIWHASSRILAHALSLQAFPFKWSYAEPPHTTRIHPWAVEKKMETLQGLVDLLPNEPRNIQVYLGDSADLPLDKMSVDCIVVDPPYAANVMYGEVSDFFYVWLKRLVGDLYPEAFATELVPKEEEAIANPAKYRGVNGARNLAEEEFEAKLEACFRDMRRVLRDDGVMTLMFTHRKARVWGALAKSLMKSGFTFRASWPVITEQISGKFAKREKGVLKATILLACEKREKENPGLWEEIIKEIRRVAEKRVALHSKQMGLEGTDLLVSVYGPVLGVFADYYPVRDAGGNEVEPERALEVVSDVVNRYVLHEAMAEAGERMLDAETRACLGLLYYFPDGVADYDSARLATLFGGNITVDTLDVKAGRGLLKKKGSNVQILTPQERVAGGFIDIAKPRTLKSLIDVVHMALVVYQKNGLPAVKKMLLETGRDAKDSGFLSTLRAVSTLTSESIKNWKKEGRVAAALLQALGHSPEVTHKRGERITHWFEEEEKDNK